MEYFYRLLSGKGMAWLAVLIVAVFSTQKVLLDDRSNLETRMREETALREKIRMELMIEFQKKMPELIRRKLDEEAAAYLEEKPGFFRSLKDETGKVRYLNRKELRESIAGESIPSATEQESLIADKSSASEQVAQIDQTQLSQAEKDSIEQKIQEEVEDPVEKEGVVESIERALVQRGTILLPKGTLQAEPSFVYGHFSSNRINIQGFSILPVLVIGDISTETVKRDLFIQTLAFKYGLLHNLQGELKIPSRYEYDRVTDTNGAESTRNKFGLGDIEFALSRQIAWENGGIVPDLVFSLAAKTRTGDGPYNRDIGLGTGHWALRGSLIAARASDPAVIFGSLSYTWNIERDIENFGTVDPGNSIGYSLGTAIALSYQTAITFSFDHSITLHMERNGNSVANSFVNSANFRTGFNWALNERASIDFAVSMGLTEDAPDMMVELRFPYIF